MKMQMDRKYPILRDVGEQSENNPDLDYIFMYDDGQVYRAFACRDISVNEHIVTAFGLEGKVVCSIPAETAWRYVHRDNLEFVTGAEMEEIELKNFKAKKELQKNLLKELGLDKEDKSEGSTDVPHEYKSGFNPKLYA